jgi:site-specific recombinase XerD
MLALQDNVKEYMMSTYTSNIVRLKDGKDGSCAIKLSEALLEFNDRYVFMRGYAPKTADSYEWAINNLIKFTGDIKVCELTLEHLIGWRHHVDGHLSTNAVNVCSYRIRKFIVYWNQHCKDVNINTDDFLIPKKQTKLPNYLTKAQLNRVYEACRGSRERLIVSMLYSTGIRVSELCAIKLSDIQEYTLLIHGKNNRERNVFLDKETKRNIDKYVDSRESNSIYLFDSFKGGHLKKGAVERIVNKIGKRAGLCRELTPHVFRHTHATILLQQGCDLRHIQTLLGHADISTTQIYTHVNNASLKSVFEKYHVALV